MGDPKDAVYEAVLEAMRPLDVEYVEGEGATDQPAPSTRCPRCGAEGRTRYTGSEVLEGSLEMYHLVHTEVEHHLRCASCAHAWTIYKLL